MDHLSNKISNMISRMDFSEKHEKLVWNKVLPRIQASDEALSLGELDHVSGGVSKVPDQDEKTKDPQKK